MRTGSGLGFIGGKREEGWGKRVVQGKSSRDSAVTQRFELLVEFHPTLFNDCYIT